MKLVLTCSDRQLRINTDAVCAIGGCENPVSGTVIRKENWKKKKNLKESIPHIDQLVL